MAVKRFSTKFGVDPLGLVGPTPIIPPGLNAVVFGDEEFISRKL